MGESTEGSGHPAGQDTGRKRPLLWALVTLVSAVLLYVASAGPLLYLAFRLVPDASTEATPVHLYYIMYRPHLDLCYRDERYYRYLFWFGEQAGRHTEPHATFKRDYQRYLARH